MSKRLIVILSVILLAGLLLCGTACAAGRWDPSLLVNWTDERFQETYGTGVKKFVPADPQPLYYILSWEPVVNPVTGEESEGGWTQARRSSPASAEDVLAAAGDLSSLSMVLTDDPDLATYRAVVSFKYNANGRYNYKAENVKIPMYQATQVITLTNLVTRRTVRVTVVCRCFTESQPDPGVLNDAVGKQLFAGPRKPEGKELNPFRKLLELENEIPFECAEDGDGVLIINYFGAKDKVTVPDEIGGKPVTGLGYYAFGGRKITSVKLPGTLAHVDEKAFCLSQIKSVDLPDTVTSVGASAFAESLLESAALPDSVTGLGPSAFARCERLKSVRLSAGLTAVPEKCFFCSGLTSVDVPEPITEIGTEAFAYCLKLSKVTLPETLAAVGARAFEACENLTSLTLPERVSVIGEAAFRDSRLAEFTCLGEIEEIGMNAFARCDRLVSVRFEKGVKKIADGAFAGCETLQEIDLSGAESIGNEAFSRCEALQIVILSDSLKEMGGRPFGHARPDDMYNPLPEGFRFIVPEGSYAETWAKENGYPYELLSQSDDNSYGNELKSMNNE